MAEKVGRKDEMTEEGSHSRDPCPSASEPQEAARRTRLAGAPVLGGGPVTTAVTQGFSTAIKS